jgi:hypothetical protein
MFYLYVTLYLSRVLKRPYLGKGAFLKACRVKLTQLTWFMVVTVHKVAVKFDVLTEFRVS